MSLEELEERIIKMSQLELLGYLMEKKLIKRELRCDHCNNFMTLDENNDYADKFCWRCKKTDCPSKRKRVCVRIGSFFEPFKTNLKSILKIIMKYSVEQQLCSIDSHMTCDYSVSLKVINKIVDKIPEISFTNNKLGGIGKIIQVDETMLNYKCKSHRGRSPDNKTDALVIVECGEKICRAFAKVIPNKESITIIPIICENVISGSQIFTDEHKSYSSLTRNGFIHNTVCHKYEFVNKETGAHTQFVESFNNIIKQEIKKRMGIMTEKRQRFLNEICWRFNNKIDRFEKILDLIKIEN